ncbi:class I SAM-dependent methyltransferase [Chloroflexota bacterium]
MWQTASKGVKKMLGGGMLMPDNEIPFEALQSFLARLAFAAEFVTGKSVLDVACGSGYGSSFLFDKGAKLVVGGDISAEAIEVARRSHGRQGIAFLLLDSTKLPFSDNSFDAIISMDTIEHLEQYELYLSECKRVLKEGGVFICSTAYRGYGVPGITKVSPFHVHEFYPEELQGLMSRFLTEVKLYGQDYLSKGERIKWAIKFKTARVIAAHIPKVYPIIELLYRRFRITILHKSYMNLSQIEDQDKILTERCKPSLLIGSSSIPQSIIIIGYKISSPKDGYGSSRR